MISEKLQKAINDQITAELWSSNIYLQMSFFLEKEGWDGFAHWMLKQSEEEKGAHSRWRTTLSNAEEKPR